MNEKIIEHVDELVDKFKNGQYVTNIEMAIIGVRHISPEIAHDAAVENINSTKIKDAAMDLGQAVYNLFELLAKDHSIDIDKSENELRTAYEKLSKAVQP